MKIGAVYPQIELGDSPAALGQVARAAEEMGLDHLLMYDHVLGVSHEGRDPPLQGPYDESDPFHDPLVAFGYLSGITKRLEFFTGVLILPQRQTALVARQAADVALLSNGRLTLGVGVGWNPVEYAALGQAFETRGKRLDEQIPLLRRLWGGELVQVRGRFDAIDRAALCPRPRQQIPIFCGGFARAAFLRAARVGDGFVFGGQPVAGLIGQLREMGNLLEEAGRSRQGFGANALILNERFEALPISEAADAVCAWRDAGGTHASIVSTARGFTTAEQHIDYFAQVLERCR